MTTGYIDSLDIANRALGHVGNKRLSSIDEDSAACSAVTFVYDKDRRAELRRNVWRFSIRRVPLRPVDNNTRLLAPRLWNSTQLYLPGAIVSDANGTLWQSTLAENQGNEPAVTSAWDQYYGPVSVHLYDDETSYYAGELVYTLETDGSFVVFQSLENANEDEPGTAVAWDATVTYDLNDVVSYGGFQWRSLIVLNTNVTPAVLPNDWDAGVTYSAAQTVLASDGFVYSSVGGSNLGNDPTFATGLWTKGAAGGWARLPAVYPSSTKWLPLYAGLRNLGMYYPINTGTSGTTAKSLYRLPSNWLREAPQDPKAGSWSLLGGPSGLGYSDRDYEGDYFLTAENGVILYRFVADVMDVRKMDDLFCDGLAARIGYDVCEELTQSDGKQTRISKEYLKFMGEARIVNAIETGPTEPPEDDYITARL